MLDNVFICRGKRLEVRIPQGMPLEELARIGISFRAILEPGLQLTADRAQEVESMTLDADQAAQYLFCSVSQISELAKSGRLRACKVGKGYTFKQEWLDTFLEVAADQYAAQIRESHEHVQDCLERPALHVEDQKSSRRRTPIADLAKYLPQVEAPK